jgi:pimeloyl-ACP methyl ester carboxylesterase
MPRKMGMQVIIALTTVSLLQVARAGIFMHAADHAPSPAGKLVDLGGYRLHINTIGKGGPSIVLIAGSGDYSFDWSLVQREVSQFARVSSYDRAGSAWSDLGPTPRTMKQEAYELHLLLRKAGVHVPYVLVGHSLGGLIARIYANMYPGEVAGIVLVDSTHEDTTLSINGKLTHMRELAKPVSIPPVQTMKSSPPKPPTEEDKKQAEFNAQTFGPPKIEPPYDKLPPETQKLRMWALTHPKLSAGTDTFFAEELQAMYDARQKTPCPLEDKPLITMVGIANQSFAGESEEMRRLFEEKRKQKTGFAGLSRNSKIIFATQSGHHIQLDEPELVVEAIREVVEAVRHHSKLHP